MPGTRDAHPRVWDGFQSLAWDRSTALLAGAVDPGVKSLEAMLDVDDRFVGADGRGLGDLALEHAVDIRLAGELGHRGSALGRLRGLSSELVEQQSAQRLQGVLGKVCGLNAPRDIECGH
jgi:hypothetical protein